MKKVLLILISTIISINSYCQIFKRGIIYNNAHICDTAYILGVTKNNGNTNYYVQTLNKGVTSRDYVAEEYVEILNDTLNFWENVLFENASYNFFKNRSKYELNSKSKENTLAYLAEIESNNKFYDDPYVEDYISQLINRIYFEKLNINSFDINITPKLINDPKTKIQPLPNGFVIIGIDFLTKQETEEDLTFELTKVIAHIILKHSTININNDTNGNDPFGLKFSSSQTNSAEKIAKAFIESKKGEKGELNYFISEKEFILKLSGIINYIAWQNYYNNDIEKSTALLNKLIKNNLAVDETYFLKAKILRQNYNSYSTNMEALELLKKAEENRVHGFMDVYKEKGLILLRLGRTSEAREAFHLYKSALTQQEEVDQHKVKWCNYMLYRCAEELNKTANLN